MAEGASGDRRAAGGAPVGYPAHALRSEAVPARDGVPDDAGQVASMLRFDTAPDSARALRSASLHRAIGVVHRPRTERQSHYLRARVADQYDAVIHVESTTAVEPPGQAGRVPAPVTSTDGVTACTWRACRSSWAAA